MTLASASIVTIWRPPFAAGDARVVAHEAGSTVSDLVQGMAFLPPDFAARGVVILGGHALDRARWRRIRPREGQQLTFHYPLADGEGAGKAIAGILLAVATVFTAGLAAAGVFQIGGLFAAGSLSAKVLAMSISLVGGLAGMAISKPPARDRPVTDERGPASLSGNLLQPDGGIPRVIGEERRLYPPLGAEPLVWRDGKDEVVEAFYVLAGPHRIRDIRVGDTPVADAEDVQIEIREGWADDPPMTMVRRYGRTRAPSLELSAHQTMGDEPSVLQDMFSLGSGSARPARDPTKSLPRWHAVACSQADEVWMHLMLPGGLQLATQPDKKQVLPFRIRMRAAPEDPWINLPELHYASASIEEARPQIVLRWGGEPEIIGAPEQEGWVGAWKGTPGQASPYAPPWQAHASFSAGAGGDGHWAGVEAASNVRRVQLSQWTATILLDESEIPRGEYEIEVKRGAVYAAQSFDRPAYSYSGDVLDWFHYVEGTGIEGIFGNRPEAPRSRENISDRCYLIRVASVVNRHPVADGRKGPGLAIMAVRARNRSVEDVSVSAAGYVRDWSGTDWTEWTVTGNPAPHYVDVLRGPLAADPLPAKLLDQQRLVDWRAHCATRGYEIRLVSEGAATAEVLDRIASVGYARPRQAARWGVISDRDRSAEEPSQIFTARNSYGLTMSKAFAILPDAIRVTWKRAGDLRRDRTMLVWRPGREGTHNPRIQAARYEGMVDDDDVRQRVLFDLRQAELRSAEWTFRAPPEAVISERGDLIGLNHMVLDDTHAAARVADVEYQGGAIASVILDTDLALWNEPDLLAVEDVAALTDFGLVGRETAAEIRLPNGQASFQALAGPSMRGRRLVFASPAAPTLAEDGQPLIRPGALTWIGRPGRLKTRMIVTDITYDKSLAATVTAVPEAPELWS